MEVCVCLSVCEGWVDQWAEAAFRCSPARLPLRRTVRRLRGRRYIVAIFDSANLPLGEFDSANLPLGEFDSANLPLGEFVLSLLMIS